MTEKNRKGGKEERVGEGKQKRESLREKRDTHLIFLTLLSSSLLGLCERYAARVALRLAAAAPKGFSSYLPRRAGKG
jgi:hypothetical protein